MDDTFDFKEKLLNLFIADSELPGLLGITDITDMSQCNDRMRRKQQDSTIIDVNSIPFFDFAFIDAAETKNFLVNKGLLEFNIYASEEYFVNQIKKRINKILKSNYGDMRIIKEGQISMPTADIYGYRVRYRPLVWS